MSDTTVNQFLSQAADATARTGFVPAPPTPAADLPNGYLCYQRDTQAVYAWDSNLASWVLVAAGGGNVTAAGTLTSGQPVLGGGGKAVAVGPINLAGGASFVSGDLPFANLEQGSALSVLGVTGNATADNASIAAGTDHQVLRRSGTAVAFGAVNLAQSAAVTGVLPVANGGTGQTDGAAIRVLQTTLTDAQIKALPTTPITVVAAPASGFKIKFIAGSLMLRSSSGAYTNVTAATGNIRIETPSGVWVSTAVANQTSLTVPLTRVTDWLTVAQESGFDLIPYHEAVQEATAGDWGWLSPANFPYANVDASLLRIAATNAGGNYTGGNAANTLKVTIYYCTEAL